MFSQIILDSLRPLHGQRIYDLVDQAGVDVRPWSISKKSGDEIDPFTNTYRNSQWTFGGKSDPLVACIWWNELVIHEGRIVREGNSKGDANEWGNRLAAIQGTNEGKNRLRPKITKAQAFDQLMSEAYRLRKPVRVVVLDGDRATVEEAEFDSSKASKRKLDEVEWWVHSYDPYSGKYQLVREVPPPPKAVKDPFNDAPDPAEDAALQEWIDEAPLSDTEKEAILKIRVGQGYFREALLERWKGCAVTQCKEPSLLLASHIKPWSKCTTRAERLSPANGLLLTPHLDKLFDRGLITFNDSFKIVISSKLTLNSQSSLNVHPGLQLRERSFHDMKPYLEWHREVEFVK